MTECPYCQSENPIGLHACLNCGASLSAPTSIAPTSSPSDALEPGMTLNHGRYTILHEIGRGGFGITYQAFDPANKRYVAIKELYPDGVASRASNGHVEIPLAEQPDFLEQISRFRLEADTLKQLRHPNAVKVLDFWEEHHTAYLCMEYLLGETLEQRLHIQGRRSEREVLEMLEPLLGVLKELHALGLLHRDIKPANLVLTGEGPILVDFGSAVAFSRRGIPVSKRLLTPAYAPLEQYGTQVKLGPPTDFYALAATMYEALTAQKPPSSLERSNGAILVPIRRYNPLVSAGFAKVLEQGLQMRVTDRPQSAARWLEALLNPPKVDAPPSKIADMEKGESIELLRSSKPTDFTSSMIITALLVAMVVAVLSLFTPRF